MPDMEAIQSMLTAIIGMLPSMDTLQNILTAIPGIVLGCFTFYFALQKTGQKVLATYSMSFGSVRERCIDDICLINKKNKPVIVFSIQAVINKDVVVEVERFEPALIIKPLESVHIKTTPFSYLYLGKDRYTADYLAPNKVDLYLVSDSKKIKCDDFRPPQLSSYFDFNTYRQASKSTETYNGKVINDDMKYAILYKVGSESETALIDSKGFICEGWSYAYNAIPEQYMETKEMVMEYLSMLGYDRYFDALIVDDLKKN